MTGTVLHLPHALLPEGWARNVRVTVRDGVIAAVVADAPPEGERLAGIAVPALPNLHSHAFQRGLAGLSERRGAGDDDFWVWRETMYRFLGVLSPEDAEAIATFAYMEMLEGGFGGVAEFHYLHHDPAGGPYADPAEMAGRMAAAAATAGIGLTLLPCLYTHGNFAAAPPGAGQRRFINGTDAFLDLLDRCRAIVAGLPGAALGVAPHSLRAVGPDQLAALLAAFPAGPVHIHAAEQQREVADCLAATGQRPVEFLLAHAPVDARWCLVHATHMTAAETRSLAASGAVAGLCPMTEASLGDGIFPAPGFLAAGGRFGVGTDSNIALDAAVELRQLEFAQRLGTLRRNVLAAPGASCGRALLEGALAGGARASGRQTGAIAPGQRADIVLLDPDHPDLAGRTGDAWLDGWIFIAGRAAVREVRIGGAAMVREGRHVRRDAIRARYARTMARVLAAL
jgi:formimidoylglutamate deiminase